MVWLLTLMLTARAGDPALIVQHGRLALELDDPVRAEALARTALTDAEGRGLLYEALAASGQGARALVEVQAVPVVPIPWAEHSANLGAAMSQGDPATVARAAKALAEAWPDHPELLVPLWDDPAPPARVRSTRDRLAERVKQTLDRSRDDALYAWRARALFLAAGWPVDPAHRILAALGEPEAPTRGPMSRHERSERARVLTNAAVALPGGPRGEQMDIVDRAAEIAFAEHLYDRALDWWNLLEGPLDDVEAVEGRARALVALERAEEAVGALDAGVALAADPWVEDRAALATAERAAAMVRLLEARAMALEASNHPIAALGDQATADLLAGRTRTSPLEDRVRKVGLSAADTLKGSYRAPAAETALVRAEEALAAGAAEEAAKHATAAIFLFAWIGPADWRLDCARAHAVQARALATLGQADGARVAWAVALLLQPEAPADWWVDAARLHQDAGHVEIALSRYATGRARGGDTEVPIQALGIDPSRSAEVLASLTLPIPEEAEKRGARVERGEVYRFTAAAPVTPPQGSSEPARPPGVGERMAAWSVQTDAGPVSSAQLHGRAVVLLFWVAQCDTCLQALQESGPVARSLREGGRDVAVVAVSMDQEERYVQTLRQLERSRVSLAHDPALGHRLGVQRVPTMWIVDPGGTVQYVGVGWHGPGVFERALRRALQE